MTKRVNERMSGPKATVRDRAAITRFFDGLELLEPGVVQPQLCVPSREWPARPRSRPGAESQVSDNAGIPGGVGECVPAVPGSAGRTLGPNPARLVTWRSKEPSPISAMSLTMYWMATAFKFSIFRTIHGD